MNDLFEKLTAREERLAVVGLGYVGLPLAVAFAMVAVLGDPLQALASRC